MSQQTSNDEKRPNQEAKNVGGNVFQVGGDYTSQRTVNLLIPVFLISITLLGGLMYWGISMLNQGGVGNQANPIDKVQPSTSPSPAKSKPPSPTNKAP